MTARELYEYALIEVNKIEAPSLLLEDYNYFINKAVQQYINKVYNRYDINQQSTDDLKVLKTSSILPLTKYEQWENTALLEKAYIAELPNDYLHILNCIVEYLPAQDFKCYETNVPVHFAARRLTADMYAGILNNAYMRPMYKRPYYYINNVNTATSHTTNPSMDNTVMNSNRMDSVRDEYDRVSNTTKVLLELRYGKDDSLFVPKKVYVDYIKSPMFIRLTQSQLDMDLDTSQVLEFPDYVCF